MVGSQKAKLVSFGCWDVWLSRFVAAVLKRGGSQGQVLCSCIALCLEVNVLQSHQAGFSSGCVWQHEGREVTGGRSSLQRCRLEWEYSR